MKRLGIVVVGLSVASGGSLLTLGRQAPAQQRRPNAAPPLLDVVQGLYINQLQQFLELTDEQYLKIATLLKDYVRDRYQLDALTRTRTLNQLRQAVKDGAPDDRLVSLTQEFDRVETDLGSVRQKFFAGVDPLLQVRQRAQLRIYIVQKDNQILNLMKAAQNPGGVPKPPQNPPAPPAASKSPHR